MDTSARQLLSDSLLRYFQGLRDLLGRIPLHIEKEDGGAFMARDLGEGLIEGLILEGIVRASLSHHIEGIVIIAEDTLRTALIQKSIVCYTKDPRTKLLTILATIHGKVGLDEGILRYVVGKLRVATTEGSEEATDPFLTTLDKRYVFFAVHRILTLRLGCVIIVGECRLPLHTLACDKIYYQETYTNGCGDRSYH